ncbi:glucose-6-phosphate dehydrogenase [Cohnella nanjingensis]|uniref:Glucose-6-phosphate 1-dehydrogenase n=1 Tax=Cohnella nanjingensis TaxID=1387779 RepID=A0A7X0RS99_9BACL|nr:glucose-6-phosphate dehydrogenase [Cohnella nanjingensis]MBB6672762.1 glucose-6-phosphate dehydrogenase [Cohnella nanjingensis]
MQASAFVLFGATGDLAKRKIFPALYNLHLEGKLPERFAVFALGRKPFNDELFRVHVAESLGRFSRKGKENAAAIADFAARIQYHVLDARDPESYIRLKHAVEKRETELGLPGNRLFYLSVAPEHFGPIAMHIRESGLGNEDGRTRLVIEKPFGHDLASARSLNDTLGRAFPSDDIYYIDHYLGKPMVQNLQALIASNPVLKAVLNNHYVANVQITASETVGVEARAGYYDQAGALRDMFQNHMLQLLMMTARHSEVYDKRKIIDSVYPVNKDEAANHIVRGRYAAGEIEGNAVPGYRDEPGVDPQSNTDTYVAARLQLDDPIWRGVPFYIRTGKRLSEKSTRIVFVFKNPLESHSSEDPVRNYLSINIQPNQSVDFQLNLHGLNGEIQPVPLHFATDAEEVPEAYELLLFDALHGDPTFFAHWDEIELSWKWVQPILEAFEERIVPLHAYPAGSNGPLAADRLLAEQGFAWVEHGQGQAVEEETIGESLAYVY